MVLFELNVKKLEAGEYLVLWRYRNNWEVGQSYAVQSTDGKQAQPTSCGFDAVCVKAEPLPPGTMKDPKREGWAYTLRRADLVRADELKALRKAGRAMEKPETPGEKAKREAAEAGYKEIAERPADPETGF